ncbi:MAG: hypothetical protein ABSG31_09880 [Tepidisphaeraceae bacterium]|jgi:hypothetical protein
MKRLGRWIFTAAAVVSLVVCLLTVTVWTISHFAFHQWEWRVREPIVGNTNDVYRVWAILSFKGAVVFDSAAEEFVVPQLGLAPVREFEHVSTNPWVAPDVSAVHTGHAVGLGRLWYVDESSTYQPGVPQYELSIPDWTVALLTAVIPVIWATIYWPAMKHRKRLRWGKCVQCGYDLRATPERCPECGMIPPNQQAVSS